MEICRTKTLIKALTVRHQKYVLIVASQLGPSLPACPPCFKHQTELTWDGKGCNDTQRHRNIEGLIAFEPYCHEAAPSNDLGVQSSRWGSLTKQETINCACQVEL